MNDATSAAALKLFFFGVRYATALILAKNLGVDSTLPLLIWGLAEIARIAFDFGMETTILASTDTHEEKCDIESFYTTAKFRIIATIIGQIFLTITTIIICSSRETNSRLPIIVSFQFSGLMTFGYLIAHAQKIGGYVLKRPIPILFLLGSIQIGLALAKTPPEAYVVSFEISASAVLFLFLIKTKKNYKRKYLKKNKSRRIFAKIWPLGGAALVGIAYSRLDGLLLPFLNGPLLSQYIFFQRIASAPLMLFSVFGSVSIPILVKSSLTPADQYRANLAKKYFLIAFTILCFLISLTGFAAAKKLPQTDIQLYIIQSAILLLQVSNGFSTVKIISQNLSPVIFRITCRSAILGIIILPYSSIHYGVYGLAASVGICEAFTALQHYLTRHKAKL